MCEKRVLAKILTKIQPIKNMKKIEKETGEMMGVTSNAIIAGNAIPKI